MADSEMATVGVAGLVKEVETEAETVAETVAMVAQAASSVSSLRTVLGDTRTGNRGRT